MAKRTARWTTVYNDDEVEVLPRRGGVTRGVLHYRGRDGIPGDMGRGFARRRPFDFDFETIMRG